MVNKLAALLANPIMAKARRKGLKGLSKVKRGKQWIADEETHAILEDRGQYSGPESNMSTADKVANFVKEGVTYVPGAGTAIGFGADIGEWMQTNLAVNSGGSGRGSGRSAFSGNRMAGDLIAAKQ